MIVGLEGAELTAMERAWLKLIRPGGVILFRRNIESASQTFALLGEVNKILGCDILRCVDVEGGLVDRLRDCMGPMPSAAAVAASGKRELFWRHGALIGREVHMLGFNTTLAPVLDLALPISAPVLRTRAASADPAVVIGYAGEFLDGLAAENVIGCGKHFPGLGGGALDSHQSTPSIERTPEEMWRTDLLPYRRLAKKLPMVMISHGAYPRSAGGDVPASLSRPWIDLLKGRIGFKGLILSDDLEMGGVLSRSSIGEAAVQALTAGTHLIEICRQPALIVEAYEAVLREGESSAAFRRVVLRAASKVQSVTRRLPAAPAAATSPSAEAVEGLRSDILSFAAQLQEPSATQALIA